ncbi:transposase [Aliikangiella sp. G2MR2-5]|uniref:transposase n=1 Tax=Aliikangiella sp. G2MR2-5 TaxID=2788943 RepID=UPI0018AA2E39|nr:transposase [Aliikangiella sp. G2MR2-5]
MAIPRKYLVDSESVGFYHCISRCVRRAYLCGDDPVSGRNCDHRKVWLEKRMLELADIFCVSLYAYAIMDNHYHLVLKVAPKGAEKLTDEQVAECWLKAYPGRLDKPENLKLRELKKQAIMTDRTKLAKYRKRLGKLSWFMARLNEPLAKQSNLEDCVNGRFWESRYQSIPLLDETSVLACMAYVDLNPIRAGITQELEASLHTSIKKRIDKLRTSTIQMNEPLVPMNKSIDESLYSFNLNDYLALVEWTGRSIVHPNKAVVPLHISSIFRRLNLQQDNWLNQIQRLCHGKPTMMGSIDKLRNKAKAIKKRWVKGIGQARLLYQS